MYSYTIKDGKFIITTPGGLTRTFSDPEEADYMGELMADTETKADEELILARWFVETSN